mmetsp:Transcript_3256/g.13660  ORF Transcript_3256/g.13660 Transcript_3256/m.13660 type:complete len:249 (+) Transcript_3256:1170-1916(+)
MSATDRWFAGRGGVVRGRLRNADEGDDAASINGGERSKRFSGELSFFFFSSNAAAFANSPATLPASRSAARRAGAQHRGPSSFPAAFTSEVTGCHARSSAAYGRNSVSGRRSDESPSPSNSAPPASHAFISSSDRSTAGMRSWSHAIRSDASTVTSTHVVIVSVSVSVSNKASRASASASFSGALFLRHTSYSAATRIGETLSVASSHRLETFVSASAITAVSLTSRASCVRSHDALSFSSRDGRRYR